MLNRRILVIDDNPAIHEDFRKILRGDAAAAALATARAALFDDMPPETPQENFEVDCAEQGQVGLDIVQSALQRGDPYAVAFVDMLMPSGWDGVETIEHLWRADPQLQIVICTAFADLLWERVMHQLGHSDQLLILRKPFDSIEVWQLAHSLTQKWQLAQQVKRQLERLTNLNEALEQRVTERTAQLTAAMEELAAFSSSVAHDLRMPLRAIHGFTHVLLNNYAPHLHDEAQGYLQRVATNALLMGQLIDDLLRFARLSQESLQKQPVALMDLVRQVLEELRSEYAPRQVEIILGDLPVCQADPALLKQVWVNLLSNALKFTRARAEARIEVGCHAREGEHVYYVRDNGVGFEMQDASKLFGVFQRLHHREDYEGTGVGLALTQRIVRRHGGRIWAEAAVDQGATFSFTLGT